MWKDLFLKMLIVSYTIWVAITFSPLLHRAVLPLSATNQPPIRPRRLLSPNRACYAPIVNSFTFVCDIKHFSEHFFNKPTTGTRVAADSAAASTALQPLLLLDVIALLEFELSLVSKIQFGGNELSLRVWGNDFFSFTWDFQFLTLRYMPRNRLYRGRHLQIFWCLKIHISHFLNLQ